MHFKGLLSALKIHCSPLCGSIHKISTVHLPSFPGSKRSHSYQTVQTVQCLRFTCETPGAFHLSVIGLPLLHLRDFFLPRLLSVHPCQAFSALDADSSPLLSSGYNCQHTLGERRRPRSCPSERPPPVTVSTFTGTPLTPSPPTAADLLVLAPGWGSGGTARRTRRSREGGGRRPGVRV